MLSVVLLSVVLLVVVLLLQVDVKWTRVEEKYKSLLNLELVKSNVL